MWSGIEIGMDMTNLKETNLEKSDYEEIDAFMALDTVKLRSLSYDYIKRIGEFGMCVNHQIPLQLNLTIYPKHV